jgi:hypothetical protein
MKCANQDAAATRIAQRAKDYAGITIYELACHCREGNLPRIRYAVWLAMEEAGIGRAKIATLFERDRSTITLGIKKAKTLKETSIIFSELCETISDK